MVKKFLAGALFSFVSLVVSAQAFAQADVIEKRQDAMKGNSANAKAIKAAVESKDYATGEVKAKDIMATADRIPSLFPKGSTAAENNAKTGVSAETSAFSPR